MVELDIGLQGCRGRAENMSGPCRVMDKVQQEERKPSTEAIKPSAPLSQTSLQCFWCDQPGHRVMECPVPIPRVDPAETPTRGVSPRRPVERSQAVHQLPGETPRRKPQPAVETPTTVGPMLYDSTEEQEENPMVSAPVCPFAVQVVLVSP